MKKKKKKNDRFEEILNILQNTCSNMEALQMKHENILLDFFFLLGK